MERDLTDSANRGLATPARERKSERCVSEKKSRDRENEGDWLMTREKGALSDEQGFPTERTKSL